MDFDSFLLAAEDEMIDFYGIQVNKLEFFKKYFYDDYKALKKAYEEPLLRLVKAS